MKENIVVQLNALADKNRLMIIEEISKKGIINCTEAEDIIGLSQPTTSHHIKILIDAGIIKTKKNGRCLDMSIDKATLQKISKMLEGLV